MLVPCSHPACHSLLPEEQEMMPSLAVECLGGSLWIPAHPELAAGEKAGRRGRQLLPFPAGNPLLVGLSAVKGRNSGIPGSALPSSQPRRAGCGVTPKTSPALPAQGTVPKKSRENPSSLSYLPPCDTPRGSSSQSSSWPPAPLPSPIATGRGRQSWRSPQHPLTHSQLA